MDSIGRIPCFHAAAYDYNMVGLSVVKDEHGDGLGDSRDEGYFSDTEVLGRRINV